MGQIKVTLPDELEAWVRAQNRRKGDMSKLVTRALQTYRREHTTHGIGGDKE